MKREPAASTVWAVMDTVQACPYILRSALSVPFSLLFLLKMVFIRPLALVSVLGCW
jgi:hypothetical protein